MLRISVLIRALLLLAFLAVTLSVGGICHAKARSLNDVLDRSKTTEDDARKIEEIYNSIKKFNIKEDEVLVLIENAQMSNVDSKYLLRILVLISKAAVEDIPTKALINKILEGLAKKAPSDVIIKEAENKVLFLKNAKSILNYLILKGFEVKEPDMVINIISVYLGQGWDPSELKREIEETGLSKKEFYELSLFLKKK